MHFVQAFIARACPAASATLIAAAVLVPAPAGGEAARPLPLFDTHVHYGESAWSAVPVDQALALIERAGTRMALVSGTPDEGAIRLHRAAPTRVIPELRPYRTRADMATWFDDPSTVPYLEERLKLGVHKGIGEFHLHGDGARSTVVAQVVRLAVARNLPLHAHSDAAAVEHLFAHDARARVLWAHAGFTDPANVRAMLGRYPNLWVETAIRGDIVAGGRVPPDWRQLFIDFPDRFMIGTDSYIVPRWTAMPEILAEVRAALLTLPPDLAEALAWRNAARLYGVDAAAFRAAGD